MNAPTVTELADALTRAMNQLDALQSALGINSDGRLNYVGLPPVTETAAYQTARAILARLPD